MSSLVYDYIAQSNPAMANKVISNFGYRRTKNSQSLGNDLRLLVANEGEPALEEIMQIHPDREIIIDMFSKPVKPKAKKCTTCQSNSMFHNATGGNVSQASALGSQGNTFILAAAFMLAVAIIVKN